MQRVEVKIYAEGNPAFDLRLVVPVFHRWIQEHSVPGTLIDVADYRHVPTGPGVLLIAHEGDYALQEGPEHELGILFQSKRAGEGVDLSQRLRDAIHSAFRAAELLEGESTLALRFSRDWIRIRFLDRLRAPNEAKTLERFHPLVSEVLSEVFGADSEAALERDIDPASPFSIEARITDPTTREDTELRSATG